MKIYTPEELGIDDSTTADQIVSMIKDSQNDMCIRWNYGSDTGKGYFVAHMPDHEDSMRYDNYLYADYRLGPVVDSKESRVAAGTWIRHNTILRKAVARLIFGDLA